MLTIEITRLAFICINQDVSPYRLFAQAEDIASGTKKEAAQ